MSTVDDGLTGASRYAGRARARERSSLRWVKIGVAASLLGGIAGGTGAEVYSDYREDIEQQQEVACSRERVDLIAYARQYSDEVQLELSKDPSGANFFSQEETEKCGAALPAIEQGLALAEADEKQALDLPLNSQGSPTPRLPVDPVPEADVESK